MRKSFPLPPPSLLSPAHMEIIRAPLPEWNESLPEIRISAERLTLAKRRWRGVAEDGTDFGFDLDVPLADGTRVFQSDAAVYFIAQKYEPELEVEDASVATFDVMRAAATWCP